MTVDPKFMIERGGRPFILYAGLLNEAHEQGLVDISTTLVQVPSDANGQTAIVTARVTLHHPGGEPGEGVVAVFSGIGDASPKNVAPAIRDAIIRMAETRAKARALRDAVNIGVTAFEELGVDDHDGSDDGPPWDDQQAASQVRASAPKPGLPRAGSSNGSPPASEAQVKALYAIAKNELGLFPGDFEDAIARLFGGKRPEDLDKKTASLVIDKLKDGSFKAPPEEKPVVTAADLPPTRPADPPQNRTRPQESRKTAANGPKRTDRTTGEIHEYHPGRFPDAEQGKKWFLTKASAGTQGPIPEDDVEDIEGLLEEYAGEAGLAVIQYLCDNPGLEVAGLTIGQEMTLLEIVNSNTAHSRFTKLIPAATAWRLAAGPPLAKVGLLPLDADVLVS